MTERPQPLCRDWTNTIFLAITLLLGVPVLIGYTIATGFQLWMLALFLGMYALVGLSVCAGYHRCFSHKSYECSRWVQLGYAVFGAMAAENSALRWSAGHRRHHAFAETEHDPYSITRGFWWAHAGWICYRDPRENLLDNVRDLQKNPIVVWQDRWYRTLLFAGGFGLPLLIGALCGDAWAGLLWGGFLRIVIVHHSTFLVNSLAHKLGSHAYDEASTACDNWFVAFLTFGEGYHSFHHRFPSDFRNGIRWMSWDPAKWFIAGLKLAGLASKLRETAAPVIEKARMEAALVQFKDRLDAVHPSSRVAEIRQRIERACHNFDQALALWRQHCEERQRASSRQWRATYRAYRLRLKEARYEWHCAARILETLAA